MYLYEHMYVNMYSLLSTYQESDNQNLKCFVVLQFENDKKACQMIIP